MGVEDSQQRQLHPDIHDVVPGGDLYVLSNDTKGYDLILFAEAAEYNNVTRDERCHHIGFRNSAAMYPVSVMMEHTAMNARTYKVLGLPVGRLLMGHRGSEAFRGIHIGKPEKEVMLGLWSSAVMNGAPSYPTVKTPLGSLMRTTGPFSICMLPSV